jgi:hypothetical protein
LTVNLINAFLDLPQDKLDIELNIYAIIHFTRKCGSTHTVKNIRGPSTKLKGSSTTVAAAWKNHEFDIYYGGETAGLGVESDKDHIKLSIYGEVED